MGGDSDDEESGMQCEVTEGSFDCSIVCNSRGGGSSNASTAASDSGYVVLCEVCEYKHVSKAVMNAGTKEYPKWRCRPCHASSRWYDRALTSQGKQPSVLKQGRHRKKYNDAVMRFRVRSPLDPPEMASQDMSDNLQDRKRHAWSFFEEYEAELSIANIARAKWLPERAFLGYHTALLLYKLDDAKAIWRKEVERAGPHRRKVAGNWQIATDMPEETVHGSTRKKRQVLRTTEELGSDEDAEEAAEMKKRKIEAMQPGDFNS